jgi:hypothetical protein
MVEHARDHGAGLLTRAYAFGVWFGKRGSVGKTGSVCNYLTKSLTAFKTAHEKIMTGPNLLIYWVLKLLIKEYILIGT